MLVGHVPVEFTFLFYKFIEKDGYKIYSKVWGGRQWENGLVVPVTYIVCGKNKRLNTDIPGRSPKKKEC